MIPQASNLPPTWINPVNPNVPPLVQVKTRTTGRGIEYGLRLNLHPGQQRAWASLRRIIAVISGSQGGKTSFGPWWLMREIGNRGPGDYLAVTATFDLFKLKMLPALQEVFVDAFNIGRFWAGDGIIELCRHELDTSSGRWQPVPGSFGASRSSDTHKMWGRIILRSASSEGGLESATAKAGWLDECGQDAFTLDSYEAIRRRVALAMGRLLLTTTPYNFGWLKRQIYDPWSRGSNEIAVVNFSSVTNPAFPREEFEQRRRDMQDWKFKMFYEGLFENPPGLIYADFRNVKLGYGGHVVERVRPLQGWSVWVGVDPGPVNTAKIWVTYDQVHDVYYVYRESLDGNKTSAEHVHEILRHQTTGREFIVAVAIGQKSESQTRLDYSAAGCPNVVEPQIQDVEAGIDRVSSLIKNNRLFISEDCPQTLGQIVTYSRVVRDDGQISNEIAHKNEFHYLDALRYAINAITSVVDWGSDA